MTTPTLFCWSSGKDSAFALHLLRRDPAVDVVGLLTTVNETHDRVAMHAVRRALLRAQAAAAGLELWEVRIPSPCDNATYEVRMREAVDRAVGAGVRAMAFGDLFLTDVREYRERMLRDTGLECLFPLWGRETSTLADDMIASGLEAIITCVDPRQLDRSFAGRPFDRAFLEDLPDTVDPCGERGEFHTFVHAGPMFSHRIEVEVGEVVDREGFVFADVDFSRKDSPEG